MPEPALLFQRSAPLALIVWCTTEACSRPRPRPPFIDVPCILFLPSEDFEEAAKLCRVALKGTACTDVAAMSKLAALLGRNGMSDTVIAT